MWGPHGAWAYGPHGPKPSQSKYYSVFVAPSGRCVFTRVTEGKVYAAFMLFSEDMASIPWPHVSLCYERRLSPGVSSSELHASMVLSMPLRGAAAFSLQERGKGWGFNVNPDSELFCVLEACRAALLALTYGPEEGFEFHISMNF